MSFLAKILSVFVASTNQTPTPVATNVFTETNGTPLVVAAAADPVEKEYQKLLADDDAAQEEVDKWIRENQAFLSQGGGLPNAELNRRIEERLKPVRQAYENFLTRHREHARARVAYGSFLNDTGNEEGAAAQWEKALPYDPKNPAVWNNLANYYGEHSPVKKAFGYYAKAIEMNPNEPVYYHNFGTTVYLFRKDAMEYYNITEPKVFDKAFELYAKAMKLAPDDFPLASDVAQTYYGVKPLRLAAALQAWTNALNIAHDEIEREGVYLHFARLKLSAGRFAEARAHLDAVTNLMYAELKKRLTRNLNAQEKGLPLTNAEPLLESTNIWRLESSPSPRP